MKIFCSEQSLLSETFQKEYPIGHFFLRSDNTLTNSGKTLYTPEWSRDMHYVPVLVVRIGRVGKSIESRFAHKYYQELALGISFTDIQYYQQTSALGLDSSLAYDFDGALMTSLFFPKEEMPKTISHLILNGEERTEEKIIIQSISSDRIHETISTISHYYLIKMGDCITFPLVDKYRKIEAPEQHLYSTPDDTVILNASIK